MAGANTSLPPLSFLLGDCILLKRNQDVEVEDSEVGEDEDLKNNTSMPGSM